MKRSRWPMIPGVLDIRGLSLLLLLFAFGGSGEVLSAGEQILEKLPPLRWEGDLSARMIDGIHRFMDRWTGKVVAERSRYWDRDLSSLKAYRESIRPNRERLSRIVGVVDRRVPVRMERFGDDSNPALVAETDRFTMHQVRWSVLEEVWGEGLLLTPKGKLRARIVAVPDANQIPEEIAGLKSGWGEPFGRHLAENGCQVLIPTLISRSCEFSGNPEIDRRTNEPHREWIYRQAFQSGRHIIGYEVQKILAAVDWFKSLDPARKIPTGVAGYGEGGLLALYSAAIDERIDSVLVSGYFGPRESLWEEPVYRNVWALLKEFGDAEIATLIVPRPLVIEYTRFPQVDEPPPASGSRRDVAAPGRLRTPSFDDVEREVQRAFKLVSGGSIEADIQLVLDGGGAAGAGLSQAIAHFLEILGIAARPKESEDLSDKRQSFDPLERQQRQIHQLSSHAQRAVLFADRVRESFFTGDRSSPGKWAESMRTYRDYYWEEIVGRLPEPTLRPNPRLRKIREEETWTGYEVVLDVWPDVYVWGILCIPKDLRPGEQRPVVVCQHGHNGLPLDVIATEGPHYETYKAFAARLAKQGFITFAPHNPTRGEYRFRSIQRKANPLKASLFSVILAQHQQLLKWLGSLPFVDPGRIAFYGLSWGGRTAMRVPALLEGYGLSICSGDFNSWNRKVITVNYANSYMYSQAFETYEFNLANAFDHSELAGLIAPRPFMVESGYYDTVAYIEWVGYEYAQVRRLYDELGIPERTRLEFFPGPHQIHGVGTFDFLHEQLSWPKRLEH